MLYVHDVQRFFREQKKWMVTLKSILFLLQELGGINKEDTWNCALDFFRDYNLGCQSPMSLSYIENVVLPAIDECDIDAPMGMKVLTSVEAVIIDK